MIKGWKKLTKYERKHLSEMKCNGTVAFQKTINHQEEQRIKNNKKPLHEPCWDCKRIMKKLAMVPKVNKKENG